MASVTQPLRDEHKELLPHTEQLLAVADAVGEVSLESLQQAVDKVYAFLIHHLIPHAHAEDHTLYPMVGKVMGAPQATATMSRDHVEVGRLVEELAGLRTQLLSRSFGAPQEKMLRRVLYGLYALVKVHFAKEEEVYLPILDARLTEEEARRVFDEMARVAHGGPSHTGH